MGQHYKDLQNKLHFLDDVAFEHMLPAGCIQITDEEAATLSAPQPLSTQQQRDAIQTQIDALERTQLLPRITRESLLLIMVSTATGMGLTESQLYTTNVGYSRLKDFDASIVALRNQMGAII